MSSCTIPEVRWETCILPTPTNPIEGLAAESVLFESLPEDTGRLMLWRSTPSVVIGKNQVPWGECDPLRIEADGGTFARRQSGGGAVYHDPGNLCYSVMLPKPDSYCPDLVGERICVALRPLGLPVTVGPRHILEIAGRKVSGTAFCYRRGRVLHHGTLLVQADLPQLQRWLTPAVPALISRAVASVPSPVVNLLDIRPDLTMNELIDALANTFGPSTAISPDAALAASEFQRFASKDWRFGLTPPFSLSTTFGEIHIRKGLVDIAPPQLTGLIGHAFHADLIP